MNGREERLDENAAMEPHPEQIVSHALIAEVDERSPGGRHAEEPVDPGGPRHDGWVKPQPGEDMQTAGLKVMPAPTGRGWGTRS